MTITRADLRKELQNTGLTYREARKVVTAIFEILSQELKKTGTVGLPFGELVMHKTKPRRDYKLGKIVRYRRPQVRFREKK